MNDRASSDQIHTVDGCREVAPPAPTDRAGVPDPLTRRSGTADQLFEAAEQTGPVADDHDHSGPQDHPEDRLPHRARRDGDSTCHEVEEQHRAEQFGQHFWTILAAPACEAAAERSEREMVGSPWTKRDELPLPPLVPATDLCSGLSRREHGGPAECLRMCPVRLSICGPGLPEERALPDIYPGLSRWATVTRDGASRHR